MKRKKERKKEKRSFEIAVSEEQKENRIKKLKKDDICDSIKWNNRSLIRSRGIGEKLILK
jgi:hypothetical protein